MFEEKTPLSIIKEHKTEILRFVLIIAAIGVTAFYGVKFFKHFQTKKAAEPFAAAFTRYSRPNVERKDLAEALQQFTHIVANYRYSDFYDKSLYFAGLCSLRLDNISSAESHFQMLINEEKDSIFYYPALYQISVLRYKSGAPGEAIDNLQKIISDAGDQPIRNMAQYYLANIFLETGNSTGARQNLEALLQEIKDDNGFFLLRRLAQGLLIQVPTS